MNQFYKVSMLFFVSVFMMSCLSKKGKQTESKTMSRPDTMEAVKMPSQGQIIFEATLIKKDDVSVLFEVKTVIEKGRGSIEFSPNEKITVSVASFTEQAKEVLKSLAENQTIKLTGLTKPAKIGQANPQFIIQKIEK